MSPETAFIAKENLPSITIERVFRAPVERVWRAWTDPAEVMRWWGPEGFTAPIVEFDFRVGGALKIVMRSPQGVDFPNEGEFVEIVPVRRLAVITRAFPLKEGGHRLEGLTEVEFHDEDTRTRMVLTASILRAASDMAGPISGMEQGWGGSIVKLGRLVEMS
jgi:uncharacterized protein YndB with AHSA1/START domain